MANFAHLHLHTVYSLLDGATRIDKLISRAKEFGQNAVAITDHGVMFGVIDFYKEAKKQGIKPIIGCEVYVAPRTMQDKEPGADQERYHLILLAKNNQGYKNLMKIVSLGYTDGFYYKPRTDRATLENYSEGLIALSGCFKGEIPQAILNDEPQKAREVARWYSKTFGKDNFYLEIQNHGLEGQDKITLEIAKIGKEQGLGLVATNDVHYLDKSDSEIQDILMCIQMGKSVTDTDRMKFDTDQIYFKSTEEMAEIFKDYPNAIENTQKIADLCNVEIEFDKLHLPKFEVVGDAALGVPPGDNFGLLKALCYKGLEIKYGQDVGATVLGRPRAMGTIAPTSAIITERLEFELETINKMNYTDYFLIVHDFVKFAKDNGIAVGPGRGSAAGSIVSYLLDITTVEPTQYNLLFERFLNPERVSMPDIDIDFCQARRQEVIDYVAQKYGKDHVAQISTFGTLGARAAIRDVGRVLDIPYAECDRIAKMIPFELNITLHRALEQNRDLKAEYDNNEQIRKLIDCAISLEGVPRHVSTHAAGVVITEHPTSEYVPMIVGDNGIATQFPMGTLEELGLLKMDFLGLKTLTVIQTAVDTITNNEEVITNNYCRISDEIHKYKKTKKIKFAKQINRSYSLFVIRYSLEKFHSFNDTKSFELIAAGNTDGIFQLESHGMKSFLKELKPNCFEDIIAAVALYRPGPMDSIPTYIENKRKSEQSVGGDAHIAPLKYKHPALESILGNTYGCIIYQEQVMQIVQELAGYTLGQADILRRAMSKKKHDIMKKEQEHFLEGCEKNGIARHIAASIFGDMMSFASYAFNKSHAAAYAVIAYQTAYLKVHYPAEFMAALLGTETDNTDKITKYIAESRNMGIEIAPCDINESMENFTPIDGKIRFGLVAIKGLGHGIVNNILAERKENGTFKSFHDFLTRMLEYDINKRAIEGLIKAGSFDRLAKRSQLIAIYEHTLADLQKAKKTQITGQSSMFDETDDDTNSTLNSQNSTLPDVPEFPFSTLLALERESTGIFMSGSPLDEYKEIIKNYKPNNVEELHAPAPPAKGGWHAEGMSGGLSSTQIKDDSNVTIAGILQSIKTKNTKTGSTMAFAEIADETGTIEVVIFPKTLDQYRAGIADGNVVILKGRAQIKGDVPPSVITQSIQHLTRDTLQKVYIKIPNEEALKEITPKLEFFHGKTPVYIHNAESKQTSLAPESLWVNPCDALEREIEDLACEIVVK